MEPQRDRWSPSTASSITTTERSSIVTIPRPTLCRNSNDQTSKDSLSPRHINSTSTNSSMPNSNKDPSPVSSQHVARKLAASITAKTQDCASQSHSATRNDNTIMYTAIDRFPIKSVQQLPISKSPTTRDNTTNDASDSFERGRASESASIHITNHTNSIRYTRNNRNCASFPDSSNNTRCNVPEENGTSDTAKGNKFWDILLRISVAVLVILGVSVFALIIYKSGMF